ncbi:orotidine 5'-phosphate decarboxylase [Candidatus Roizmanbacteria bacterium RIFCSPLOWO2_01_FULL_37_12]|uniref:Orotidine-5'-phosphate decarboxylase n=1 Tax=Candidatus Roizmanbacteria bacterium RIFCSPLOWO2_01_FULL_37_12 TaxID=1802056 RepID=A0A1F7ID66_9BACT|nr:MAG: orotidine 5'-phosphate decarboxylase [Candidatus Roizmanbacteria bacterium RIFCSPHIGHO2_02_FULL_37_9b]OGK41309.1 MAG: orotidine 5'-phosphate decarboxylase [Candidatus Roizmanbacteria bacterium RIFCSPLOWO2_01_FULL_37_12]
MNFQEKLDKIVKKNNSFVCVGLDSDFDLLPKKFSSISHLQFEFNKWIIDQTHDLVCAYKPNSAFYEARGADGIKELKLTCNYLRKNYPEIPIILDAKRGDIGSTNKGYLKYAFDYLGADAITLHPYLGKESLESFLKLKDKGFFILSKTSNPGAGEFQNLKIIPPRVDRTNKVKASLNQYIALRVVEFWNKNKNCMLVVGATYPQELAEIRKIVGDMTFLVPGIGAQGGDLEKTLKAGLNSKKSGLIINSSRGIIFSENPRIEAKILQKRINKLKN